MLIRSTQSVFIVACVVVVTGRGSPAQSAGEDGIGFDPANPYMLDLAPVGTEPERIDFDRLPTVPAQHAIVSDVRDRGGTRVHQHGYLEYYSGRFWAMWSDGPGGPKPGLTPTQHRNVVPAHDLPDTRVSYATSNDGLLWSKPAELSGPPRRDSFGWIARGF